MVMATVMGPITVMEVVMAMVVPVILLATVLMAEGMVGLLAGTEDE